MRVKVNRTSLLMAIKRCARLGAKSDLHLEAKGNKLRLKMATGDIAAWLDVDASVSEEGDVAVRRETFTKYVELAEADIMLETWGDKVVFTSEDYTVTMKHPVESFFIEREPPDMLWKQTFDAGEFWNIINMVQVNASRDEARPTLCGIEFSVKDGVFKAAATDGYTLSRYIEPTTMPSVYFVLNAVNIAKLINLSAKGKLTISVSETDVFIEQDERYFHSITSFFWMKEKFPDYEAFVPKHHYAHLKTKRLQLIKNLQRARVVSPIGIVTMSMCGEQYERRLAIDTHDTTEHLGVYSATQDAEVHGNININLDARYVIRSLITLRTESILFEFTESTRPVVIRVTVNDGEMMFVVMPMHPPR